MTDSNRIGRLTDKLTAEIEAASNDLLNKFPLDKYIAYLNRYPKIADYKHVSKEVAEYCNGILKVGDERTLENYHKLLLVTLVIRAADSLGDKKYPGNINEHFKSHFASILKRIEADNLPPGTYRHETNTFCMDVAICTFRMVPIGMARKMYMNRFPVRYSFNHGWRQFFKVLRLIVFDFKGIQPLYFPHIDSRDEEGMAEFGPEGLARSNINIAEMLKINKNVKGVWGKSWYYDPKVLEISPRLKYFTDLHIETFKGTLVYCEPGEGVTKHAIATSPTRRKLYEEGKYIPTNYLWAAGRKNIIEWASKQ